MSDYGVKTAKIYDPLLHIFIHSLRKKILKIIRENRYKNILDVCCGTGNQLKMLQKHGISATGIDLSEEMLEVAKSGNIKAHCLEQNAEDIDFRENSFDLVMTTFALHEKSNESASRILNEMIRVSNKNGHLMLVDYAIPKKKLNISRKMVDFIEYMAGDEHYGFYKKYIQSGGLNHLLIGLPLKELKTIRALSGNVEIKLMELI